MTSLKNRVKALEERLVCLFEDQCEAQSFPMKFRHLHQLCEDADKLGSIRFLEASANEHFDIILRRAYRRISMKRASKNRRISCPLKQVVRIF